PVVIEEEATEVVQVAVEEESNPEQLAADMKEEEVIEEEPIPETVTTSDETENESKVEEDQPVMAGQVEKAAQDAPLTVEAESTDGTASGQEQIPEVENLSPVVEETTSESEVVESTEEPISDDVPVVIEEEATEVAQVAVEEESIPEMKTTADETEKEVSKGEEEVVAEVESSEDFDAVDLNGTSKSEQLDLVKKMLAEENVRKIDSLFKGLGAHFDLNFQSERKTALEKFLKVEGADAADFEFKGGDVDQEFHSLYEKLRRKRAQFFQELGKEKDNNLKRKNEILVLLRDIIDGEDQESFNKVKKLQEEWKSVGQVPGAQNQTLWASYHALMDRFYDHRSIYFELKELDRKKNLAAKSEICKKAETLDASTNITQAIAQLNELHEEFKHIGPVPREDQEELWQRFKAASDLVYEKRNEHHEHQKAEFKANLEKKLGFVENAKALAEFDSDRIKHWNGKTKELMELQKQWEAVGGMPRQSAKEVNKAFWGSFKKFFANKSKFFKKLDRQKEGNLTKKKELISKALELREGKDWESTANAMKALQGQWKEIGPVPDKLRKSVYEEFNEHCNYFFERKRGQNAEQNKEFEQNLEKKMSILAQLESMNNGKGFDLDGILELLDEFSTAGLVPRNAVGTTLEKYDKVCKKILETSGLSESDTNELKVHIQVSKIRNSPHGDRKINRKEGMLKRKISGMENDIYNWKRNIDFFGRSKNAEHMKMEFQGRIDEAEKELENMKQELRLLQQ
ncbi:MAG: DUF349 domain-containing protein, partial [Cytophagales bacterium]|nr:DUF349 domain-containing protein [Cytophagales bacterium]